MIRGQSMKSQVMPIWEVGPRYLGKRPAFDSTESKGAENKNKLGYGFKLKRYLYFYSSTLTQGIIYAMWEGKSHVSGPLHHNVNLGDHFKAEHNNRTKSHILPLRSSVFRRWRGEQHQLAPCRTDKWSCASANRRYNPCGKYAYRAGIAPDHQSRIRSCK